MRASWKISCIAKCCYKDCTYAMPVTVLSSNSRFYNMPDYSQNSKIWDTPNCCSINVDAYKLEHDAGSDQAASLGTI